VRFFLKVWRQSDSKGQGAFVDYELDGISSDMSFLEMLDILNIELVKKGEEAVAFDHDCREGICGMCSMYINGRLSSISKYVFL
jgi:succinate dehydrogenase / fumarate reductase iron-sulfur subunit